MKKAILAIAATGMLFGLFGCNHSEVKTLKPTQAAELTPMQQSWRGVIPCADCEGIETSLFLEKGNPIESKLNYTLEPVNASLPTTPMAMRGMYFYMADAATFTDCATGQRVAVANNAQLERDYAAAQGSDSKPILLVVDGHFTVEPNPDTGAMVKTLATDKAGKFTPGKDCSSAK